MADGPDADPVERFRKLHPKQSGDDNWRYQAPHPDTKLILVTEIIPPEFLCAFQAEADKKGVTLRELVMDALRLWWADPEN